MFSLSSKHYYNIDGHCPYIGVGRGGGMMSEGNTLTNERRRSWIGILLALLLVCGCVGLAAGPGMPFIRNVLDSGQTATPVNTTRATNTPTKEPTSTIRPTREVTPEKETRDTVTPDVPVGDGACLDPCDPAKPACLAGISCVPRASASDEYVCYNRIICEPNVTEAPSVTEAPVCSCGDGVCEQNRCNELIQNCPADCAPPPSSGARCGDQVCSGNESCRTCSRDCGPC